MTVIWETTRSEEELWTVGFRHPSGQWEPESDHATEEEAEARVRWLSATASEPYLYMRTEPGLWTVGHYEGDHWVPDSDHGCADEAAKQACRLNGGIADKPITFEQAEAESAFDLARLWGDRSQWPVKADGTVDGQLAELAVVSGLRRWLDGWRPIHIHNAILLGANPQQVADAFGGTVADVGQTWYRWAIGQRRFDLLPLREYEQVAEVFSRAGYALHHYPPARARVLELQKMPKVRLVWLRQKLYPTSQTLHPVGTWRKEEIAWSIVDAEAAAGQLQEAPGC